MKLELIPVVEISYHGQKGIPMPDHSTRWRNPELWDLYHALNFAEAGFKDALKPYLPGSSFYRLKDISDDTLMRFTRDYTRDLRAGSNGRETTSPFLGGYVLNIDGLDKYFPQCCGNLADIHYWRKLSFNEPAAYNGHPAPHVSIKNEAITLDFSIKAHDEEFLPQPPEEKLHFSTVVLRTAIEAVQPELTEFANRLVRVNAAEALAIEAIDQLLVWGEG